jgi:hypothetical protein
MRMGLDRRPRAASVARCNPATHPSVRASSAAMYAGSVQAHELVEERVGFSGRGR